MRTIRNEDICGTQIHSAVIPVTSKLPNTVLGIVGLSVDVPQQTSFFGCNTFLVATVPDCIREIIYSAQTKLMEQNIQSHVRLHSTLHMHELLINPLSWHSHISHTAIFEATRLLVAQQITQNVNPTVGHSTDNSHCAE